MCPLLCIYDVYAVANLVHGAILFLLCNLNLCVHVIIGELLEVIENRSDSNGNTASLIVCDAATLEYTM